ncbi:MAG: trypsin-like peptidase domain-containing protein [Planctomycetes bacterium]|nr:trypsin-like peptidase domain-containing protein [Planctomycetota bacterium]
MMKQPWIALSLLLAPAPAFAQAAAESQADVYDATVDSVVGIRTMAPLGERSGTGVVLDPEGLILTSYSIAPEGASNIRVWFHGPRFLPAELVATDRSHEISLLRVKPRGPLKPIAWGDSSAVKVGDVAYTIGNAANAIINNDAAALNAGLISGRYRLTEDRANATYTGTVIETTAAVNVGMEGAPLLDVKGRMVGFVTLNYSPSRFLGAAIPVDVLKPAVERLKSGERAVDVVAGGEAGEGYLGATFLDRAGRVIVDKVEKGSPAERMGLIRGIRILAIGSTPVKSAQELNDALKALRAGSTIFLKIDDEGLVSELTVQLDRKK